MKKRGMRISALIGAVLVLSAFGYLVYGGIGDNIVYFVTPDELLAKGDAAYDAPVRLGGMVVPGTVQWEAETIDLRFTMKGTGDQTIDVHATKAPPQMFRENMGVIVEGKLTRSGVFEASTLMVKHSNEYTAPKEGEDLHEKYKSIMTESGS